MLICIGDGIRDSLMIVLRYRWLVKIIPITYLNKKTKNHSDKD